MNLSSAALPTMVVLSKQAQFYNLLLRLAYVDTMQFVAKHKRYAIYLLTNGFLKQLQIEKY
jgi:hypothetical protein